MGGPISCNLINSRLLIVESAKALTGDDLKQEPQKGAF